MKSLIDFDTTSKHQPAITGFTFYCINCFKGLINMMFYTLRLSVTITLNHWAHFIPLLLSNSANNTRNLASRPSLHVIGQNRLSSVITYLILLVAVKLQKTVNFLR